MIRLKQDHAYCQILRQFSEQVESVHEVGPNTGQHWAEEGKCWCNPDCIVDFVPGLPNKVKIFSHKKYKPNWG